MPLLFIYRYGISIIVHCITVLATCIVFIGAAYIIGGSNIIQYFVNNSLCHRLCIFPSLRTLWSSYSYSLIKPNESIIGSAIHIN